MAEKPFPVLTDHKLTHLPNLKVDPVIFSATFSHACSMQNCNATCCQGGVLLDVKEKENILSQADIVLRYMEPDQVRDPQKWFDNEEEADADYPSGRGDGTQTTDRGCVFLMRDGRCVLQYAAMQEGIPKQALKPFFCFAFPVTIDAGVLTIDDPDFTNRPECCSMISDGSQSVLEICREEFDFVLGTEGTKALIELSKKQM